MSANLCEAQKQTIAKEKLTAILEIRHTAVSHSTK